MKRLALIIIYIISISSVYGQTDWDIMTRVPSGNNAIKIRWMPANATDWQKGAANGYTIIRKVHSDTEPMKRDTIEIPRVSMSDSTLSRWSAYWKPDSANYKDLFYLTVGHKDLNIKKDTSQFDRPDSNAIYSSLDERYFYASILADLKFKAAELCGLGYTDISVVAGNRYEYIITTKGKDSVSASTGIITVNTSSLPDIPISFTSELKRIKIGWNTSGLIDYYGAYYVEKSTNAGASYTRLNEEPFVNLDEVTTWMFHVDSIPNTTATYRYRVVGVTYFDELRYSAHRDTTITKVIEYAPGIRGVVNSGANFKVNWRYPHDQKDYSVAQASSDLTTYSLAVSHKPEAIFSEPAFFKIIKTGISKTDTTTTVTKTLVNDAIRSIVISPNKKADTTQNFYFYILANATGAVSVQSNPYGYIPMVIDSIPPFEPGVPVIASPVDISGDKSMFLVSWKRSTDNEEGVGMLGYRVFRTIGNDPEKIEVSGGIKNMILSTDTTKAYVQDTLSKNLDYGQVKYHVSAFDKNYNESPVVSAAYTQPDTKRPLPPRIIKATLNQNNTVALDFTLSTSKRTETGIIHEVLRKESLTGSWAVITSIPAIQNIESYIDVSAVGGKEYFYAIRAKDGANNYSCDSIPGLSHTITNLPGYCYQVVSVKTLNLNSKDALTTLSQMYDESGKSVTLTWTYDLPNVTGYEIYRGVSEVIDSLTKFAYLDFVNNSLKTYTDFKVDYNTPYSYKVRAIFTDGSVSAWKGVKTGNLKKSELSSNKESVVFANVAASEIVSITSNVNWVVTKSDSWITTSVVSGTNNGNLTVGVTANTATAARQGTITVSSGGIVSTIISVTQHAFPSGSGITAKYYNFPDLASIQSRLPNVSKLETQINMATNVAPVSGINTSFSSIWEGYLEVPKTGNYTFYLKGNDGANLYIDGKKVIGTTGNTESSSSAQTFTFGVRYPIRVEHWHASNNAVLRLQWSSNVGLAKANVATPYLYPEYVPTVNQQDALDGNCFVIRRSDNNKVLENPGNYTLVASDYTGKNNQKWKLAKDGSSYKIISQADKLNKNIQILNDGSSLNDMAIVGLEGNKTSEKWQLVSEGNNRYKFNRLNTSNLGLGITGGDISPKLYINSSPFILENTACPNYSSGVSLDREELSIDFKEQTEMLELRSDMEWSFTNYNDWIIINPSGGMESSAISAKILKNTLQNPRSGSVEFKNARGSAYLTVNQGAAPCVELINVSTDCSMRSLVSVKIVKSDGSFDDGNLYEYSVDGTNAWKDKLYHHQFLSNGNHVLYVRKKSAPSCIGSIPFSIYCN